jgi:hypothetical protein
MHRERKEKDVKTITIHADADIHAILKKATAAGVKKPRYIDTVVGATGRPVRHNLVDGNGKSVSMLIKLEE